MDYLDLEGKYSYMYDGFNENEANGQPDDGKMRYAAKLVTTSPSFALINAFDLDWEHSQYYINGEHITSTGHLVKLINDNMGGGTTPDPDPETDTVYEWEMRFKKTSVGEVSIPEAISGASRETPVEMTEEMWEGWLNSSNDNSSFAYGWLCMFERESGTNKYTGGLNGPVLISSLQESIVTNIIYCASDTKPLLPSNDAVVVDDNMPLGGVDINGNVVMNGSDPAYRWYDKMNAELNGALSLWSASRLSFLNGGRANNAEWNGPFPMSSTSTSTNSPWWDEVFKNSVDKPNPPTYDGEYDGSDVHLDGWKHNPEEMGDDESRWMSTCLVSGDGFYSGNWTDPTKISAANGYSVYYESYYKVFDFGHNITTSEYPVVNEGRTAITNMNGWSVNYVSVDGKCTWQLSIVKRGSKYDDTWIGPIRMTSLDGNAYKMLFKNSETKPDAPTITPPNYTGWSESPVNPPTGQSTYMTSNYQRYDLSYVYPEWSDPICITGANGQNGVDGANIEFIYRREKTDHLDLEHFPITNSATENNHIPDGWENNPQGVSSTYMYEWCAIRHKPAGKNVQWNNFGDPFIWAKWGANGIDGDGTEYIFTYTMTAASPVKYTSTTALPTEGSVAQLNSSDPATWGDNPISVSENVPFMWCQVGRVKYKNDENENTVIDTITWSDPSLWANFSREVQAKGLVVEVSNEMMGIPVTATTVNADWEETAYVRMYSNKDLIDITEITVTPSQQINGMTITATRVSDPDATSNGKQVGKVVVSIDEGSTFPAQGMSVNISVKNSDGDVRHGTINLAGLSFGADGEMYSLNVSAATIKKNKDTAHPFTPEELEVHIKHTKGTNGMENLSIGSVGTESFTVKYAIDGDWSNSASLTDSTVSLGTGSGKVNPTSIIEFKLYYNTDILVDQESVQVVKDGEQGLKGTDGADGDTQEFIYFLHSGTEERIWNLSDNDNPYAWNTDDLQSEDAIPAAYAVGSDFDATDPSTYLNKWMDNPVSVSPEYRYLYYSTRTVTCTTEYDSESGITEKNYTYGRYSSPIPWSVYGKSGIDGDGVEYIYFLSSSTAFDFTAEGAANAQNGNNPTLWNSSSNTDRNGKTYSQGEYVGPAQVNDTANYWYDDPQSLQPTKRTQWISSRKYNGSTKTWGQFTPPVVWNTLAENGKNYSLSVSNTLIPLSTTWNDKKTTGSYSEDIIVQILLNGSPLSGITVTNGNSQQVTNTSTDPKKVIFNFTVNEGTTLANTISYPYTASYTEGSNTITFDFNITVVPMVTGKIGDPGPQGASVKIIGTVPTLAEKNAVETAGTFNGNDLENGDGVMCEEDGHLWVWAGEDENGNGGSFIDCGQIKGEQGEQAWVHIAWSYWSNGRQGGTSTGASDYDITKNPSKEYRYMGIYSDHKPDDKEGEPEEYTWSEIVGENAVSFQVYTNVQYIAYDPNETDEEDKFVTKTINLGISQTNGSSQTLISKTYYVDSKSGTFRLRYRRDNSTYTNFTNATANNTQLSVTSVNPSTSITIELQRSTNNGSTFSTIDTKTLFLEKNGINGTNGVDGTNIEYVYYLTNSASPSFTDNTDPRNWINLPNYDTTDFPFNDTFHTETATAGWTTVDDVDAYNGWTDSPRGVRNNAKYEFYAVRESYIDANNKKHWHEFSKPVTFSSFGVQGLTGDGVQYIYLTLDSTDVEIGNNPNSWAANTSETYTGPTSGEQVWTRNPTVYSSMGEGNVQYVSTRQYKLNSAGTAKEWTKYSAPSVWSYKPKNGVNAIYYNIDTNNDNIALSVDQDGNCTSTEQKTATITLYGNGTAMTLTSATKTTSGISQTSVVALTKGTTSATLTITPTTSTVISEGASVTVTLKSGTVQRSITINVTGVHYAKDGINATSVDLVTSATSIKYNPDAADVSDMYVPNVIVPYIKITDGSTVTTYAYSHSFISGNNKWGLSYYYNGVETNSHNVTTGASNVAVGEDATTQMTFVLTYNGNRYDNETISLVSDGAKGDDGTSVEFIYYRPKTETEESKTTPIDWSSVNNGTNPAKWGNSVTGAQEGDFPFNETFQTAHPDGFVTSDDDVLSYNGWTDNPLGVTQDARFEYAAMRLKEDGVWGEFQTPFAWGTFGSDGFDGDGVEYIFSKSNTTNPHNWYNHENYQSPEYIPEASSNVWFDEPPTITQGETVYYSMRRYKLITASTVTTLLAEGDESDYYLENFANVKAWLPYSAPVVWNHYPTDGEDTEGAEYIYCRTKIDISSKWNAVEKVATGVFYGENLYGSSTPLTNYYYTYSTNNATNKKSVNPANWVADSSNKYIHSDHKNKIWYDSPQGITKEYPYEWMAMRTNPVGADGQRTGWTKFVKPKIWSRWGSDGTDGDGVEYIFAKNFTSTDTNMQPQNWYTNGDYQKPEFIPEAAEDVWSDNPPAVVEGDYTYCSIRKYKYIDSTTIGTLVSDSNIQSYYTSHFNNDSAWLPYSEPQIWSHFPTEGEDSEGEEFIYCRTKIDITDKWGVQENIASDVFYGEDLYPTNNPLTGLYYSNFGVSTLSVNPQRWDATQTAGFIEGNFTRVWYDHPQGVTEEYPYEWSARRTNPVGTDGQRTGWGKYSLPKIWSHYGVDGKDGDGVEYIYFRGYPNSYVMDYDTAMTTYNDIKANFAVSCNPKYWVGIGIPSGNNYNYQSNEYIPTASDAGGLSAASVNTHILATEDLLEDVIGDGEFSPNEGLVEGSAAYVEETGHLYIYDGNTFVDFGVPDENFTDYGSNGGNLTMTSSTERWWADDPHILNAENQYQYVSTRKKRELSDEDIDEILNAIVVKCLGADNCRKIYNNLHGYNGYQTDFMNNVLKNTIDWRFFVLCVKYDNNPSITSKLLTGDWNTVTQTDITKAQNLINKYISYDLSGGGIKTIVAYAGTYNGSTANNGNPECAPITEKKITFGWTVYSDPTIWTTRERGEQGLQGAILRHRGNWGTYSEHPNEWYCYNSIDKDSNDGLLYTDLTTYSDTLWQCIKPFQRASINARWNPYEGSEYWKKASKYDFVATYTLYADSGLIKTLSTNDLVVFDDNNEIVGGMLGRSLTDDSESHEMTTDNTVNETGQYSVRIWAGKSKNAESGKYELANAPFNVRANGKLTAMDANIAGDLTVNTLALGDASFHYNEEIATLPKITAGEHRIVYVVNYSDVGTTLIPNQADYLYLTMTSGNSQSLHKMGKGEGVALEQKCMYMVISGNETVGSEERTFWLVTKTGMFSIQNSTPASIYVSQEYITTTITSVNTSVDNGGRIEVTIVGKVTINSQGLNQNGANYNSSFNLLLDLVDNGTVTNVSITSGAHQSDTYNRSLGREDLSPTSVSGSSTLTFTLKWYPLSCIDGEILVAYDEIVISYDPDNPAPPTRAIAGGGGTRNSSSDFMDDDEETPTRGSVDGNIILSVYRRTNTVGYDIQTNHISSSSFNRSNSPFGLIAKVQAFRS